MHKISYNTAYGLKIFVCVLVFLNYLKMYKINAWYLSYIMYGYYRKKNMRSVYSSFAGKQNVCNTVVFICLYFEMLAVTSV